MQQTSPLKNVAIVNENPDWLFSHGINQEKETIKKHVQCFPEARSLLNYLKELKRARKIDEFPDYVLIDMSLPDMKASHFLDSFEHIVEKNNSPEVFILSSSPTKKKRDLAMQYSFVSAFLEKPVPSDLLEVLVGEGSGE